MKFTKEQFNELGKFYLDDFPINDSNQDVMLNIFNVLPNHLQGLALSWGLSDSVFRNDVFEYLLKKLLNMSVDEYYESKIAKDWFDNGVEIELDFNKFKDEKI